MHNALHQRMTYLLAIPCGDQCVRLPTAVEVTHAQYHAGVWRALAILSQFRMVLVHFRRRVQRQTQLGMNYFPQIRDNLLYGDFGVVFVVAYYRFLINFFFLVEGRFSI